LKRIHRGWGPKILTTALAIRKTTALRAKIRRLKHVKSLDLHEQNHPPHPGSHLPRTVHLRVDRRLTRRGEFVYVFGPRGGDKDVHTTLFDAGEKGRGGEGEGKGERERWDVGKQEKEDS
jgi:hypothetical protein